MGEISVRRVSLTVKTAPSQGIVLLRMCPLYGRLPVCGHKSEKLMRQLTYEGDVLL